MAAYKYTAQYGSTGSADVAIASGDAEAQSDTISINIDLAAMGRAEAIHLIDKIKDKVLSAPWPPL
jgi:hypothetical protein